MKKKLLLVITMVAVLACLFALTVLADGIHSNVDKTTKVVLDSGEEVSIFDSEGNALIWYIDNSGILQSIRADDIEDGEDGKRVVYFTEANRGQTALAKVNIYSGNAIVGHNKNIVVFNIMDDDIAFDTDPNQEGIQPMTLIMETFNKVNKAPNGVMLLEYAYLRLDTTKIGGRAFGDCTRLKYINIEELTELESMGATDGYNYGGVFRNCSSLFANRVVDLTKTRITTFKEGSPLYGNFAQTPISGIKLPSTVTFIGNHTFYGCKNLTTVFLDSNPEIEYNAFVEASSLKQIFYSGSYDSFNELLKKVSTSGNAPFWSAVGENNSSLISYSEYKDLADKNVKCAVYDYNSCNYNGVHEEIVRINACVSFCNKCGATVIEHFEGAELNESIAYTDYSASGTRVTYCTNEGCTYNVTKQAPALFTCLGYSAPENGKGGIAIGFTVNNVAITEYGETTGKAVKYGIFAVMQDRLGDNDIFANDGTEANGVISAEMTNNRFSSFGLKIIGFSDEYKDIKLAMGAYVAVTDGEITEYSYMQGATPSEGEKYCFVSYNDIVAKPEAQE